MIPTLIILSAVCMAFHVLTWAGEIMFFIPLMICASCLNMFLGRFQIEELIASCRALYSRNGKVLKFSIGLVLLLGNYYAVLHFVSQPTDWLETLCFTVSLGMISACFTIPLAHELLHEKSKLSGALAQLMFYSVLLPFFGADHLFGHHLYVGSEDDRTTAKHGENFYLYSFRLFMFRIKSGYINGYRVHGGLRNRLILSNYIHLGLTIVLLIGLAGISANAVMFILIMAINALIGYILYDLTNYIQHYGLSRGSNGEVTVQTSWNCYYKYSNYILLFMPFHSYHHLSGKQQKEAIRHLTEQPEMPLPFFAMMGLALFPRSWFRTVDPLLSKYTGNA